MSAALTATKLKRTIEGYFHARRKNLLVPKDEGSGVLFIVDDIHLGANIA